MEVGSTLTVGEAAAKLRPPPPATPHPARASSLPGSRSTGMVRTGVELGINPNITNTLLFSQFYVEHRLNSFPTYTQREMQSFMSRSSF